MKFFYNLSIALLCVALLAASFGRPVKAASLNDTLQSQISALQQQIDSYQTNISSLEQQKATVQNQVNILADQINTAQLSLQKISLAITDLNNQIKNKQTQIATLKSNMQQEKIFLQATLREIDENPDSSTLALLLSSDDFSSFFSNIQQLSDLQNGISSHLQTLVNNQNQLEAQETVLQDNLQESNDLANIQQQQVTILRNQENQKNQLMSQIQKNENTYSGNVQIASSQIAAIKKQLYILHGDGSSGSMNFDQAYQYAETASKLTGVPASLLLGILDEETGWGNNVGTGNWQSSMEPASQQNGASCVQQKAFLEITQSLGLNPDKTPVSRKPSYGWGGAMGPAQFLPCTWLSYASKISSLTGHNPPSPWNIEDAFTAAGLYLAVRGATAGTYASEHTAAAEYIGGGNWQSTVAQYYADNVMSLADQFQEDINILNQSQQ